ncbi:MAG TPA: hypothetical protein ENI86_10720 [Acidimicrobiales bacterium]|nr:hypothetical protein [Acidimicrobiales bacterium]
MILAQFEVWHSRPVAPTRRVALGASSLPMEGSPGHGALLLAGVVAAHVPVLEDDERSELLRLMEDLAGGRRVAQPRMRHRFQTDRVGLTRANHQLVASGGHLAFRFHPEASPVPQVLAAAYRTGRMVPELRRSVFTLLRSAVAWRGGPTTELLSWLTGAESNGRISATVADPWSWAIEILGVDTAKPSRREIQKRFRSLLRDAHPDGGAESEDAARRISELAEARRILLTGLAT